MSRAHRGGGRVAAALAALAFIGTSTGCTADRRLPVAIVAAAPGGCGWTTAGNGLARLGSTGCPDTIDVDNVSRLTDAWFAPTTGEVTAAPAVDDTSVYSADWAGWAYAFDRTDGHRRWAVDLGVSALVYAGQFTSSPTLADIDGRRAVVIGGGHGIWALDAADGSVIWQHAIGDMQDPQDSSEVEASPAVAGDLVISGYDVHNDPSRRGGVIALDLATGERRWTWDPEEGLPSGGCGDVWGAPAVDETAGLVFTGTANCPRADSWGRFAEAIVALDLTNGTPLWSYQPHQKGNDQDWDFAGAPNLFQIGDRPVVGLGNKDGRYYVVDRATGEHVWDAEAQRQVADGDGYAFGGFIGATAVSGGVVVGATAIGDCPCVHAFDAATGQIAWQNSEPSGTYASAATTSDLLFMTSVDQTIRAFRLTDGSIVWSSPTRAISASGPAIAGHDLYIGVGFREPGTTVASLASGVQAFRVLAAGETAPTSTTTSTAPEAAPVTAFAPNSGPCVGAPCDLDTTLKEPPAGSSPKLSLEVATAPLQISLTATGLGAPAGWLRPGSAAARDGATVFGLYASPRDDQPQLGTIVCSFTENEPGCSATAIRRADAYTRFTVVALADATTPPTLQDGFDRLVTTLSVDPPLIPEEN